VVKKKLGQWIFIFATVSLLSFYSAVMAVPASDGRGANKSPPGCRAFSIYDADQNGSLNRDEYHQLVEQIEIRRSEKGHHGRRNMPPLGYEEVDSNKDGLINEDEMISALNRRLRKHRRYRYQKGM